MTSRVEEYSLSPRLEVATRMASQRSRVIGAEFGTTLEAGRDPLLWTPFHSLEQSRSIRVMETIFNSALNDRIVNSSGNLMLDDLPAMIIAASFFYPKFGDFYTANASAAKEEMKKSGIFRPRDFEMIPILIDSAISKGSSDPNEVPKIKDVSSESPLGLHTRAFNDVMNNFPALPDATALVPLLGVERLYDGVRKYKRGEEGGNKDAIRMANGELPRSLHEVLAPDTTYDSSILKAQIETHYKYFFDPDDKMYEPQLLTSRQHLSHFVENRSFFNEHIYPLTRQGTINLAALFEITSTFSRQQRWKHKERGGGLLD